MSGFKIEKELGLDWATILYDFYESEYFTHLENFINQVYLSGKTIYPKQQKLFQPFKDCSYDNLQVVIIDNKPVKDLRSSGVGRGILTTSTLNSDIPIELREFRDCILNSVYGNQLKLSDFDNSLYDYSENGFLFLNMSMCTEENKDYTEVWKNFIRCVIKEINNKKNIVYLFLTDDHLDLCKYIDQKNNKIIVNTETKLSNNSDIFLDCNEYLYDTLIIKNYNLW
jgi:uracil-DNA glycosylase